MLFNDVIGQASTKKHLIELVQHNRLSHALLFAGKEGSGALPLAMALAGFICLPNLPPTPSGGGGDTSGLFDNDESLILKDKKLNPSPQPPGEPDEWMKKHPSYSKVRDMVHPDIHFSYLVITKKT